MRKAILIGCLGSLVFLSACGKKEEPAPQAAAPEPKQEAQPDQAAAAPAANVNVQKEMAKADTAIKQHDYEVAADSLLKAQFSQQPMTVKQKDDHYNKMRALQVEIANAMMRGDPKAKKAAELLKQSRPQ